MPKLEFDSPITLTEITPRSFGRLDGPESLDAYGIKDYPPKALGIIHAVTEQAGFTNVKSIAPAFNRSRLSLPPFNRNNRQFTAEDWSRIGKSAIVAACSALSVTVDVSLDFLSRVKKMNPDIVTAIGGYHPTFDPEYCLERGADIVIIGEGYATWPAFLNEVHSKGTYEGVSGIAYKKDGKVVYEKQRHLLTRTELSNLPLPVQDEKVVKYRSRCIIESSYGCPGRCSFCSVWKFNMGKYRVRSPESTIAELKTFPKNIRKVWRDENFAADERAAAELLETSIRLGLVPFGTIQARVEAAQNRELVKLFKRAGVGPICVGFESDNPDSLKEMNKGASPEENEEAIAIFNAAGIDVYGMFILGWDADTPASIQKTVDFAVKNMPIAQFFVRTPGVATEDTAKLSSEGRLLSEKYRTGPKHYLENGCYVHFEPNNFSAIGLQRAVPAAYRKFYDHGDIRNRAYAKYALRRILRDPQTIQHFKFLELIESPRVFQSVSIR